MVLNLILWYQDNHNLDISVIITPPSIIQFVVCQLQKYYYMLCLQYKYIVFIFSCQHFIMVLFINLLKQKRTLSNQGFSACKLTVNSICQILLSFVFLNFFYFIVHLKKLLLLEKSNNFFCNTTWQNGTKFFNTRFFYFV